MRAETRRIPGPHGPPTGKISLPGSKSLSNRALIAAAAAGGGRVRGILDCRDTRVLVAALHEMGWTLRWEGSEVSIGPRLRHSGACTLDLEDSGTGARLLMALAAVVEGEFNLDGSARLRQRPMLPLIQALRQLGAEIHSSGGRLPLTVHGAILRSADLSIEPRSSSQFVSALLMIAPLLQGGLHLQVEGELPSSPYLLLTRQVMEAYGARLRHSVDLRSWEVAEGGYRETEFQVEADWSAAAFPLAAVALVGGEILIPALDTESLQGDSKILEILGASGLEYCSDEQGLRVRGPVHSPIRADLLSCPDLFPALVALASCPGVGGEFSGLQHLRHKESDRLQTMRENLETLGAVFDVGEDRLRIVRALDEIPGQCRRVDSFDDHRIAMAMAVTALKAGPLEIDRPECVAKSFPKFWGAWEGLLDSE